MVKWGNRNIFGWMNNILSFTIKNSVILFFVCFSSQQGIAQTTCTINGVNHTIPGNQIRINDRNTTCRSTVIDGEFIRIKDSVIHYLDISGDEIIHCELTYCGTEPVKLVENRVAKKNGKIHKKKTDIVKFNDYENGIAYSYWILYIDATGAVITTFESGEADQSFELSTLRIHFESEEKAIEVENELRNK